MRQIAILMILAASVILSGCTSNQPAPTATPLTNGVEGQAWLGPLCPVVQMGTPCPDQPYPDATVVVLDTAGKEIARVQTDAQGRFRLLLLPGTYTLRPEPPDGLPFPSASEQTFTVMNGQFTPLTVHYDSGIR